MRGPSHPVRWRVSVSAAALLLALIGGAAVAPAHEPASQPTRRLKVLLVVFDGLRPDHVTPALTPRLHDVATAGVRSTRHHSLFPTVTRVNASALATGAGPAGHGILDNSIYLPDVDSMRALDTGNGKVMMHADSVLGGRLLTAPALASRLRAAGMRLMVASAGSSGSAYLFAGGAGVPTVNPELVLPAALGPAVTRLVGPVPDDASPNLGRNAWAVDALLRVGIDSLDVDVGYLWLSDPDHTAHGTGLGSIMADSSIRAADREFGRLLDGLTTRGLAGRVNIMVVSDHGFSTHAGDAGALRARLGEFGDRVVVAGGAVYVRRGGTTVRDQVLRRLRQSADVGAIFTRSVRGRATASGTVPMELIGWEHPRASDMLFSADWSHDANGAGHPGTTRQSGVAGHGTTSPWDISATFVAAGPAFRVRDRAPLPSSNADIVPTILHLLGQPATPTGVQGRPLLELLRESSATPPVAMRDSTSALDEHTRTVLYRTRVGAHWYVDSTRTIRR
ncbi:MAG: alkaline phosphatase family protein [Gemmatimonas sp.]|uniref:alkaline phosphatase family protein n=1 Tax=Gemmatimonas sp. TaxID=1962908 RepID=UPI0025C5F85C|nr:alkaline phosphatase family protein [Gemmatimonas sp.]MCA2988825.1 alkaline phosphatase family protein [Gemmatimonas sp.]